MMPDCDREGRIFYLPLTPMIDSFSCTPFISERRFFHNAVTLIEYCDDIIVVVFDVITFTDVNLKDCVRNVHYNQCISNT